MTANSTRSILRLARPTRVAAPWLAGLLMLASACTPRPVTPEGKLLAAYDEAYAPLRECVAGKVSDRDAGARADEIVKAGGLPALEAQARRLLGRKAAESEAGADANEKARALMTTLRDDEDAGRDDSTIQKLARLQRQVAADVALAPLASVACPVPETLAPLSAEANALTTLIELRSAFEPFQTCSHAALAQRQDINGRLPEMIVAAGLGPSLQIASRQYLGKHVDLALVPEQDQVEATRATLVALGALGSQAPLGEPESHAVSLRRHMAMVDVMQIIAAAASVDCEPSENLLSWMEQAHHDYP